MDARVDAEWLVGVSAEWAAFTAQRGFLIMDNASDHDTSVTSDSLVFERLLLNTTAMFQQFDQGAINATQTTYKRGIMRDILSAFDEQFEESPAE